MKKLVHYTTNFHAALLPLVLCVWGVALPFGSLRAQVEVRVEAPRVVQVGEHFQLTYSVAAEAEDIRPGTMNDFKIHSGPNPSRSQQVEIINGRMKQSITTAYSFVLSAPREGKFTIGPATVIVDGNAYNSKPITIEVVKGAQSGGGGATGGNDMFVSVSVDRTSVYMGEAINATVKIYTRIDLAGFEKIEYPKFNGFWSEDIPVPQQISLQRENVNGQIYNAGLLKRVVLFPQRAGTLTIDAAQIQAIGRKMVRQNFFWPEYQNFSLNLRSQPVTIQVLPLPEPRPADFIGAVGNLTLQAAISTTDVKANDAVTLTLTVNGSGNLKLIEAPKLRLPADIESYEPKVNRNITAGAGGMNGSVRYDYVLVPRHAGTFELPPVTVSYFDVTSRSYKTLSGKGWTLNVAKGEGSETTTIIGNNQQVVKMLGSDIRHIYTGATQFTKQKSYFFGSFVYFSLLTLGGLGFLALFFITRKRIRENADAGLVRYRRAGSAARKRLKTAERCLKANQKDAFYEELQRALWGYAGDKLNLPAADLSRENVAQTFAQKGIQTATINRFLALIDQCEMARYAAAAVTASPNDLYNEAVSLIEAFEAETAPKSTNNPKVTSVLLFALCATIPAFGAAQEPEQLFTKANQAYTKADYTKAVSLYDSILQTGLESAELYYNIGNAYFRLNEIPKAILYYERALRLAPTNEDLRYNLQLANTKITDHFDTLPSFAVEEAWNNTINIFTPNTWAVLNVVTFILLLAAVFLFLYLPQPKLRSSVLIAALVLMLAFSVTLIGAWLSKSYSEDNAEAIIFAPSVTVRSAPGTSGTDLFVLHEGTKVRIVNREGDWLRIRISDGNTGWLPASATETI